MVRVGSIAWALTTDGGQTWVTPSWAADCSSPDISLPALIAVLRRMSWSGLWDATYRLEVRMREGYRAPRTIDTLVNPADPTDAAPDTSFLGPVQTYYSRRGLAANGPRPMTPAVITSGPGGFNEYGGDSIFTGTGVGTPAKYGPRPELPPPSLK